MDSRRVIWLLAFCLLITLSPASADPQPLIAPQPAAIVWHSDLREAYRLSVEQQRPLLIVVGADWCGPCHKLSTETFQHAELSRYISTYFVAVHLDYDRDREVVELLEVEAVPTSIVLSPRAEVLGRFQGFFEPVPYYHELYKAQEAQLRLLETQQIAPAAASQP